MINLRLLYNFVIINFLFILSDSFLCVLMLNIVSLCTLIRIYPMSGNKIYFLYKKRTPHGLLLIMHFVKNSKFEQEFSSSFKNSLM